MNAVNWPVYLGLCAMFCLEYVVWGAWMPVLAARLLGPLKMSGKQTGWIYAAMPLASLVAYPLGGYLADKYVDAKWIMVLAHAVGAVLLYVAAKTEKFGPLFFVMLAYSLFYAATLPLANVARLAPLRGGRRGRRQGVLLGRARLGAGRMALDRPAANENHKIRRRRRPETGGNQLAGHGAGLLELAGNQAPEQRHADPRSLLPAEGAEFPHLRPCVHGCGRHDAVLLPGQRPVHAGHRHFGQECLRGDGHRATGPDGGDLLPYEPALRQDRRRLDAGDRGRLLGPPLRRLHPLGTAGRDRRCPRAARLGLHVLHLRRLDIRRRGGAEGHRQFRQSP